METNIIKSKILLSEAASKLIIELLKYQTTFQTGLNPLELARLTHTSYPHLYKKIKEFIKFNLIEQTFIDASYSEIKLTPKGLEIATLIKRIYEVIENEK